MGVWPPGARTPAQGGSVKAGPCGGGVGQSSCRSHVGRTGRGEWSEAARPQRGFIPQVVGNGKKQWVKGQEATAVPGAGKWGEKNKGDPQTTDGTVGISQSPGHSLRTPPLSRRNSGVTYTLGCVLPISLTTSLPTSASTQGHLGVPITTL